MTRIQSNLLSDTLQLVQLARETALARGNQEQARRLAPVANELRGLANPPAAVKVGKPSDRGTTSAAGSKIEPGANPRPDQVVSALLGQNDFRTLLDTAKIQKSSTSDHSMRSVLEKNQIVLAMAKTDMSEVDIARQMGMTIEEVKMVVQLNSKSNSGAEVIP